MRAELAALIDRQTRTASIHATAVPSLMLARSQSQHPVHAVYEPACSGCTASSRWKLRTARPGSWAVRLVQRHQRSPRHHALNLVEELALPRALAGSSPAPCFSASSPASFRSSRLSGRALAQSLEARPEFLHLTYSAPTSGLRPNSCPILKSRMRAVDRFRMALANTVLQTVPGSKTVANWAASRARFRAFNASFPGHAAPSDPGCRHRAGLAIPGRRAPASSGSPEHSSYPARSA